jgi:hypothetical protein
MAGRIGALIRGAWQSLGSLVGKDHAKSAVIPENIRIAAKSLETRAHVSPLDRTQPIRHYEHHESVNARPNPDSLLKTIIVWQCSLI